MYPLRGRSCDSEFPCASQSKEPKRKGVTTYKYGIRLPFPIPFCQTLYTLRMLSSLHVAAHSLAFSFTLHLPFTMSLFMSIVLVLLAIALQVSGQSTIEPQPYCHPVSGSFSNNPDYWLHATPVVRAHWEFDYAPLVRRQYTDYWKGWKNISYLFALYVPIQEA